MPNDRPTSLAHLAAAALRPMVVTDNNEWAARTAVAEVEKWWSTTKRPLPRWPWAGSGAWRQRNPKAASILDEFDLASGVGRVLLGPTGCGKTSLALAAVLRLRQRYLTQARAGETPEMISVLWLTERDLIEDERTTRWGREQPLFTAARRVDHLIIDEVGYQAGERQILAVLDARYGRGLPTTITSGRTRASFIGVYGAPSYRRAITNATLVDMHEG